MSLGCYPLGARSSLSLEAQPVSVDVSYGDDLFLCVVDQGSRVAIYDLKRGQIDVETISVDPLLRCIELGSNLIVDQVIYCREGDYIACIANSDDGKDSIYVVFDWRDVDKEIEVRELDFRGVLRLPTKGPLGDVRGQGLAKSVLHNYNNNPQNEMLEEQGAESKLVSIDCCQKTGNLGVSCGYIVQIYKYTGGPLVDHEDNNGKLRIPFEHIISVKLSINALSISFVENYLSIRASDHVQVLKLELLTLQIQSDGFDCCDAPCPIGAQCSASGSGNGSNATTTTTNGDRLTNNNNNTNNTNNNNHNNITTNSNNNNNNNASCNLNNSTMMNGNCSQSGSHHGISFNDRAEITWNLNTTKLVKLPTLMHNSSSNLDSYHICHPSELLGPASEAIACRVSSSIYSPDLNQNQLELIVMLCKQFDSEAERLLSAQLEPIYLNSDGINMNNEQTELKLLKSSSYQSLASVNCFVNTTNYCHVYSLHAKKAFKMQTIIHPDQCLNVRPDLLNAYLLNPLGLQICSLGSCDRAFHYDWSSSGDLNLSFVGTDRSVVMATRNYIILVSNSHQSSGCLVEFIEKPCLEDLYSCISYTVECCDNNSIRTNLLTYLHATCHLTLAMAKPASPDSIDGDSGEKHEQLDRVTDILKRVSIHLSKQLLHKKQTNVLTNNLIDKTIKHLLDISQCDLPELVKRASPGRLNKRKSQKEKRSSEYQPSKSISQPQANESKLITTFADLSMKFDQDTQIYNDGSRRESSGQLSFGSNEDPNNLSFEMLDNPDYRVDDDDDNFDVDNHELIKIYIKHAKYSQSLLEYLVSEAYDHEMSSWLISLLFEHNPSLLIKCAQRYPLTLSGAANNSATLDGSSNSIGELSPDSKVQNSSARSDEPAFAGLRRLGSQADLAAPTEQKKQQYAPAMHLLVDKLKLLAELDSTGINRATVLFTLAILYNALNERAKCLAALDHIKPLNHLAITMRSNWEVSHSIASVVAQRYPDFAATTTTTTTASSIASGSINNKANSSLKSASSSSSHLKQAKRDSQQDDDDEDDATLTSCSSSSSQVNMGRQSPVVPVDECANDASVHCKSDSDDNSDEFELASGDSYERKLKLVAELSTSQLLDLLTDSSQALASEEKRSFLSAKSDDHVTPYLAQLEADKKLLEASINLLESQFILSRLRENCN